MRHKYNVTGIPVLVIVDSLTGFLVTVKGRKDIHERGIMAVNDWVKQLELNREREVQRAQDEIQLEIER